MLIMHCVMRYISLLLANCLLLSSCASTILSSSATSKSQSTVVLFLVDGLSAQILKTSFDKNESPQTRKFFLSQQNKITLGRATFPSLTYPNIASILTAKKIGEQPVSSNHVVVDGETFNFESPSKHQLLNNIVNPISIFKALEDQGKTSASFSYVFGMTATHHMQVALREGIDYKNHDYKSLDGRLIENLERFLSERPNTKDWPEFIYVHLVGIDGLAHLFGPESREVQSHLKWLDQRLKQTYKILQQAEKTHSVISMLTSDHGFVQSDYFVDAENILEKIDRKMIVANESRFISLYSKDKASLSRALGTLLSNPGVEMAVVRNEKTVQFVSATQELAFQYGPSTCAGSDYSLAPISGITSAAIQYKCPSQLNATLPYPFLVEDASLFLNIPNHPDAIVIAKKNFSFTKDAKGNHGGPTPEEIFVPVLMRNSKIIGNDFLRTSDLLRGFFPKNGI